MNKIRLAAACLTLALALANSMPAVAQSRLPPGAFPSFTPVTPNFNNPGPQYVPPPPPVPPAPLPTDPPMGPLGIR